VARAHAGLQAQLASHDEQRLAAWTQSLASMTESLRGEWRDAGANTLAQQHQLLESMARTAREMSAQNEAHATQTVAEIAQLLQAASDAPRVAAEVVAELRQKLSDSMARDNAMLEERSRILETLSTLLDAVNHASTEQRAAVDALLGTSADMLERVGSRFTEKVGEETDRMSGVAAQITGGAVEVASMGEAFGLAVQLFSESNEKMGAQLQRIEGALGKSIARSDEQLAYYVAQAREVIDLSIMSQKQIVEDLQRIADRQAAVGSEA
jgi:DNA anti-recombination protein RmuC